LWLTAAPKPDSGSSSDFPFAHLPFLFFCSPFFCQIMELVLSLFPGLDLLGQAFTEAGFSVVRGPDPLYNSRIEDFHISRGSITGIIAGPPCQDFSKARRSKPSGHGLRMLAELLRVIDESRPEWVLVENVPQIPDILHPAYHHQRLDIADCECGGTQLRRRHIQFLSTCGHIIRPLREFRLPRHAAILTSATAASSHTYAEICRRQGFLGPVTLPGWSREAKVRAVGNGVPLCIGRALAIAVSRRSPPDPHTDCICLCGRRITPPASHAGPACRKRMERRRKFVASKIAWSVTAQKAIYTPQTPIRSPAIAASPSHVHSRRAG
jgi:DNA (cytosine-5)-methyltransferase 1